MSVLNFLLILCLCLSGCAEVTRPTPTSHEVEDVQLTALTRHPHASYSRERAMRVFLRILRTLPRIHGRTYPFLGFNWWITEAGHPVVDNVWYPSPAHDRPLKSQVATLSDPSDDHPPRPDAEPALKQGDLILAVNGMPIPAWEKDWQQLCRSLRGIFQYSFPGEVMVDFVLTARAARHEAQGTYRSGPVTLVIDRQGVKKQVTLYPVHLPAEYSLFVVTGRAGDAAVAYAAPGRIMIASRLLNLCRTDDELAMVLGHELAHHAHGHLVRKMGRYPIADFTAELLALPFRFLPWLYTDPRRHLSEDVKRVSRDAVLSVYSRDNEREADAYGLWYAYQAGYDVEQGPYIWERLSAVVERNILESTYFLDSHPAAPERLARLKKIAQLFKAGQAAKVLAK
jgi:Zn-dependent protease with chaperone function